MMYNISDFDRPRVIVPVRIAMEIFYNTLPAHVLSVIIVIDWLGTGPLGWLLRPV